MTVFGAINKTGQLDVFDITKQNPRPFPDNIILGGFSDVLGDPPAPRQPHKPLGGAGKFSISPIGFGIIGLVVLFVILKR